MLPISMETCLGTLFHAIFLSFGLLFLPTFQRAFEPPSHDLELMIKHSHAPTPNSIPTPFFPWMEMVKKQRNPGGLEINPSHGFPSMVF